MRALTLTALLAAAAAYAEPPAALACLAKYYGVRPVEQEGAWYAQFKDGTTRRWDDGKQKTFEEKLASPDLEDMFSIPYRAGPIQPVTTENQDPGRIRYDPLFFAVYGANAKAVDLVPITFLGQTLKVNRQLSAVFQKLEQRLTAVLKEHPDFRKYLTNVGGTFNWRKVVNTDRQSAHSFGVSIDINVKHSAYWEWQRPKEPVRWRNEIPQPIVDAFEAEGFIWGGRWYHYDTMHFEYRPELLDPACRSQ